MTVFENPRVRGSVKQSLAMTLREIPGIIAKACGFATQPSNQNGVDMSP